MPRRTHSRNSRPVFDSHATFAKLFDELQRNWRMWEKAQAERRAANEQQRRIEQFRRTYIN